MGVLPENPWQLPAIGHRSSLGGIFGWIPDGVETASGRLKSSGRQRTGGGPLMLHLNPKGEAFARTGFALGVQTDATWSLGPSRTRLRPRPWG
jgi:hypothetical protein